MNPPRNLLAFVGNSLSAISACTKLLTTNRREESKSASTQGHSQFIQTKYYFQKLRQKSTIFSPTIQETYRDNLVHIDPPYTCDATSQLADTNEGEKEFGATFGKAPR
jgi:16S rRNA G966 N2-methylase RsmD